MRDSARHCIIGVDVGGTKIAAAAVDPERGTVTHRREIATRAERNAADVLEDVARTVESIAADVLTEGDSVDGIGIGVPEIVDSQGHIRSAYLLNWPALPLHQRLVGATPVSPGGSRGHRALGFPPPRFASDVRAAALAEARFGAGRPYHLFIYVSVGTGISSSLVQDGVPLVGARGGAVVLSTAPIGVPCPGCGAWSEFVLEDFASGRAIAHRYREASGVATDSALDVMRAAATGDRDAIVIVDSAAHALGSAIGWLVNVLDPEAVIIGGGLSRAGDRYWGTLTQSTRAHIWNEEARDLPILPAALGADAGIVGAALSARARAATPLEPSPQPRSLRDGSGADARGVARMDLSAWAAHPLPRTGEGRGEGLLKGGTAS